ncbi:MAG TPA: nuclear transport factor 2 family protein [Polyangiaceae bacterium]
MHRLAWPGAAVSLAATFAFACGATTPPPPELPVLGSDATCADRAQARPVCLQAVETRCAAQRGSCEAACQSRLLPGSSEKHPEVSGAVQEGPCREGCRQDARACAQSLVARCPTLCGANEGPPATQAFDRVAAEGEVARALDDLHDAAAHADEARYFAHFAPQAVFLGTDATERWDMAAFRAYAHPRFSEGKGWTFHATRRAVTFDADGGSAWFDEDLRGERLGPARGSGVLVRDGDRWLVTQYNLALTIPNQRFDEVRALLDAPRKADAPKTSP